MAQARQNSYEEIIHSLDHEHTRTNFDRHVQVLSRWSRSCNNGIYVKDLEHVNTILQLLHDRLASNLSLFEAVALEVLQTCAKPLLEHKANERLRQVPMENVKSFFVLVLGFFSSVSVSIQIECAHTIRVIINGGMDHAVLRSDRVQWHSNDGTTVQVTDPEYIQALLRAGGGLNTLVSSFCDSVNRLGIAQSNYSNSQSHVRSSASGQQKAEEESPAPGSPGSGGRRGATPVVGDSDSDDELPLPVLAGGGDGGYSDNGNDGSVDVNLLKRDMYDFRKLAEGMLYVALDLSANPINAEAMCSDGISDAAVMLIEVTDNPRDIWTSKCVELLWNCLEAYFDAHEAVCTAGEEAINFLSPDELARHDTAVLTLEMAIGVLRNLFLTLLFEGHRNADKELRNEVLIVLTLIAKDQRSVPYFVQSGMLTDLVTYSCAGEAGSDSWMYASRPMAKLRNFASVFDVDLQMKREMWLLLSDLIKTDDPAVLLCVASSPFLRVLCKYLEFDTTLGGDQQQSSSPSSPDGREGGGGNFEPQTLESPTSFAAGAGGLNVPSVSTTSQQQYMDEEGVDLTAGNNMHMDANESSDMTHDPFLKTEMLSSLMAAESPQPRDGISDTFLSTVPSALMYELQVLAASVLSECSHRMMAEFLRVGGHIIALTTVERYTTSTVPEHKGLVSGCLMLLNKCVMYSKIGKKKLEDQCAIKYLLRLFEASDDDATKSQVLRLFSIMTIESPAAQTQMCDCDGIPILVCALAKYPQANQPLVGQICGISVPGLSKSHGTADASKEEVSLLMVALLDAIWMSIVGNTRNECIFAECEGTDALLETLECSASLQRGMILRVVSDLLMNRRLLAFVESWRSSRSMRSVNQLLAHAWMDEEVRLGVSRDAGVLCNMWNPLNAHDWPQDPRLVDNNKGKSVVAPSSCMGAEDSFVGGSINTDNTSSVWFQASVESIDVDGSGTESPAKGVSLVEKLTQAVSLSRRGTVGSRVAQGVRKEAASKDMRGVIASVFTSLGLLDGDIIEGGGGGSISTVQLQLPGTSAGGNDDGGSISSSTVGDGQQVGVLTPSDKQVLCVAKRYDTLREGEWWKFIFDDLRRVGVNPIEEDLRIIELKLDAAFEATQASQFEQMELLAMDKRSKVKLEDSFMGQILRQKHQQIKSEWLKRNAHREKISKKTQMA